MTGLLVGVLFGAGVLLVARGWQAGRPPPPMIAALQRVPGHAPISDDGGALLTLALRPALELIARIFGGREAVERKLRLAGSGDDAETYLLHQVMRAGGLAAIVLLGLALTGSMDPAGPALLAVALAAVAGLLIGDAMLSRTAKRRRAVIAEQFPVAAQLMALLLSAGASPSDAVGRVGTAVGGPLGEQMVAAAAKAGGRGFAASMRDLADACDLPMIERFVYGLLSAIERGSPLSDIVREQALDAAGESHRELMTTAGKRDIAMLVPVVFAVLPTVVMVSLLPGAVQLGLLGV